MSIRVVVDDLSLQRFGGHNTVAQKLERASTCMAEKCEIATKKSTILFVRTKLLARLQPLGVTTAVRHRARLENSRGHVRRIRKIHGKSSVPRRRRLARIAHASVPKATTTGWRSLGSMRRSCSSPSRRWRRAWRNGFLARTQLWCWDGGKRARPGVRLLSARYRPHACVVGRLDAAGRRGSS